jgi:hypothetical protein
MSPSSRFGGAIGVVAAGDGLARASIAEVGRMLSNGAHSPLGRPLFGFAPRTGIVFDGVFRDCLPAMAGGSFHDVVRLVRPATTACALPGPERAGGASAGMNFGGWVSSFRRGLGRSRRHARQARATKLKVPKPNSHGIVVTATASISITPGTVPNALRIEVASAWPKATLS